MPSLFAESWESRESIPEALHPLIDSGDIVGSDERRRWEMASLVPKAKLKTALDGVQAAKTELSKLQKSDEAKLAAAAATIEDQKRQLGAGPKNEEVEKLMGDRLETVSVGGVDFKVEKRLAATLVAKVGEMAALGVQGDEKADKATRRLEEHLSAGSVVSAVSDLREKHAFRDGAEVNIGFFVNQHAKLDPETLQMVFPDKEGAAMVNPKTGTPFTVSEMVDEVIVSGMPELGIKAAMRGNWTRSPDVPKDRLTKTPPLLTVKDSSSVAKNARALEKLNRRGLSVGA